MIVAPDWNVLRGIARGLDSSDPIERKKAIENTLHIITDTLPDVQAVRIYELKEHIAVIRAATDKAENTAKPLDDLPGIAANLDGKESRWEPEQKQWLCPLTAADQTIGFLEVLVENLDDDWITWLEIIANQITHALAANTLLTSPAPDSKNLAQGAVNRLIAAAQMLVTAEDYDDIATVAIFVANERATAVWITLFEQPISIHDTGSEGLANNKRYTAAFANRTNSELIDPQASTSSLPELSFVQNLRQEIPIVIDKVTTDAGYLTGWMREQTMTLDIRQVAAFSLTAAGQIVGTLEILFPKVRPLTQEEISVYSDLASHCATVILSKRLLQHSLVAQQFATQLVKTNKALAIAENYEEMAYAVLNDSPPSVKAVAIALFNRPFTLMGTPVSLHTQAIVTHNASYDTEQIDHFSATEDARITYFLHEFLEGRMMLLWNIARPRQPVIAHSLVDLLKNEDVNIIMASGLNVRNSLRGLVIFAGDDDLRESGPQHDGLRAIADQLAAVIENRILLEQTTEALDLIQTQYQTSSRVFRSDNLADILKAVFDFSGGAFSQAQLVTTTPSGDYEIVAEINHDETRTTSRPVQIKDYPAYQTLGVLEALEIRDTNDDHFLSESERDTLIQKGIGSLVIFPVLMNAALSGLLMLTHNEPVRVARDRVRAMRSLVDQVGVVLENRNLLQNTEANLQEIQALYEANRAMLRTKNTLDVLRVLHNHLAPDATMLCLIGVQYDTDNTTLTSLSLDYEITPDTDRYIGESLITDSTQLAATQKFLDHLQGNTLFTPKGIEMALPSNPIHQLAEHYPVESYATFVVRHQTQITNLIYLIFDQPKPFVNSTRRLYEAIADQVSVAFENQNLLRESQQNATQLGEQVRALQAINKLTVQISTIKDEQLLLDTGAKILVETIGAEHCGIILFQESLNSGVVVSEYPSQTFQGTSVDTRNNPILAPEHDTSQPVVVNDVKTSPHLTETMRAILMEGGISSIMIIPLVGLNNELVGSVGLDIFSGTYQFSDIEVQTAQTIAAQLAVGIQNIRLLQDAQQRAAQLQRISDFSQSSQTTLNLEELIETVLTEMPRLFRASHISIALHDNIRDELVLMGTWESTKPNDRSTSLLAEAVPLNNTTTGYVYNSGEYLYIPDLKTHNALQYPHAHHVVSLLAVPLHNLGRVLGVVSIGSTQSEAYTDTDIAVFQQLVNQMAVAIDNARAYTQSQRIAHNKTLANEIAIKLQRQENLREMIDITISEVGQAIGAKRARIRLSTQETSSDGD
jgi:GAF domain-containing protein